mgnify:CR=1 FL=1
MRLDLEVIKKMKELRLKIVDVFILSCYYYNRVDIVNEYLYTDLGFRNKEVDTSIVKLSSKGLLISDPDINKICISPSGKKLYSSLEDMKEPEVSKLSDFLKSNKREINNEDLEKSFEEWWKTFPTTGTWSYIDKNGSKKSFFSSRHMKNLRKDEAKKRYIKIINNKNILPEDLLGSLKYELKIKKLDSIKTGTNKLEYLKGMESYLNQEIYLNYLDFYKSNVSFINSDNLQEKENKSAVNVTDV